MIYTSCQTDIKLIPELKVDRSSTKPLPLTATTFNYTDACANGYCVGNQTLFYYNIKNADIPGNCPPLLKGFAPL